MTRTTDPVTVKAARKEHACDWCTDPIRIGESYVQWRWFDLNSPRDAGSAVMHPECRGAMATCEDVKRDNCWTPNSHRRGCWCEDGTEECDCGIRGRAE